MIYKLYRIALSEQESTYPIMAFLIYVSVFELLHFSILFLFLKIIGIKVPVLNENSFAVSFIVVGLLLNYLFFIKNGYITKINDYYHCESHKKRRGNLLFISYFVFLFVLMILEIWYYQKHKS
jgi:hypothetical protein